MATIKPRRGTTTPTTGLTQYELAVDTTNKRIFIGAADGSGTLIGAAPGGSDTYVQFNDSGNLGGDSGLTYNKTTDALTVTGDVAVNGGDVTTSAATATVFNATATTLSVGGAATTLTIGATSGTTAIRNAVKLGNTTAQITTNSGTTNSLTINPYGNLILSPINTGASSGGTNANLTITNTNDGVGTVAVTGGDLILGTKNTDEFTASAVNIIFEGATANAYDTTLTVTDPTANRTITLPDATTTLVGRDTTDTLTNKTLTTPKIAQINDTNGLAVLKTGTTASAVNEVTITNNIATQAPHVSATGTDTNISLHLAPKGTGKYVVVENGTDGTKQIAIGVAGATTATTTYFNAAQTVDRTITLPDANDTLVGKATTDILTNKTLTTPKIAQINDTNGLAVLKTGTTASAVNEVTITNNIATQAPHVSATGTDTNISLHLAPKGTGKYVVVENGTDGTKQIAIGVAGATTATTTYFNAAQTVDRTITLPDATGTVALTTNLSQFAATTSAQLAGVISDETGSGALVFATSPTLVTPTLGAAAATSLTTGNTGVKVGEHLTKFLTITSDGANSLITQGGNSASTLTISHAGGASIYIGDSAGASNSTYINVDDNNATITLSGAVTADEVTAASYILSSAGISAKTASYTLVAGDNGKIITMNVATANNLTVPASLAVGFNCTIIQLGAGQTTIVASGTTLNSYQGYLKISGQHGSASIVSYTSNVYNVAGSLSA